MFSMIDSDIIHDQPMTSILMAFLVVLKVSPEVSFGVPVCNSFALLSDECATPAVLSNPSDEES